MVNVPCFFPFLSVLPGLISPELSGIRSSLHHQAGCTMEGCLLRESLTHLAGSKATMFSRQERKPDGSRVVRGNGIHADGS